jgi:hypothetical protein
MCSLTFRGVVVGFIVLLAPLGLAQEATPGATAWQELREAIARAAERPPDPQAVLAEARSGLIARLDQLEQFLAGGGEENQRQWAQWLKVSALRQELARPQPDVQTLRAIHARFFQNQAGLELSPVLAVRNGLSEFMTALEFASAPSPADLYRRRLAELEKCLGKLEAEPEVIDAHRAGAIAAWLSPLGENSAKLASAIQARYCRINGVAQISRRFINLLMAQKVEEQNFITDFVLGSRIWGPSFTTGQVSFGTLPNSRQGTLEVRLEAQNSTPANVAQRGRISVYSSAYTSIRASKQVNINDRGLTLIPAVASAATSVQINDVEARTRITERLASRRANQLLPQAEQAAAQRAQTEASGKLDAQADAALGGVHETFCDKIRAPLIRLDALPPRLQFTSDEDHLRILLGQHNRAQLAVATPAPLVPLKYDLAGYAHESLVTNLCESLLVGATVNDKAWLELMNLLTGSSPRALWVHDRGERWSVRFAEQQPLLARFDGDRIDVTLRLANVTRGQRHFENPVEVEVRFVPKTTREGPAFVRDGELTIRFPESTTDESETELRQWLTRKFSAVFPEELHLHGLVPPSGGSLGKLRQLELVEFRSTGGWLALGYQIAAQPDLNAVTEAR